MDALSKIKPIKKGRIGIYTVGLKSYWPQFKGLRDRVIGYGEFVSERMKKFGEIFNFGLVDDDEKARHAGEWFNEKNVDIIFCHMGSYCTSACATPIHKTCKVPVIILDLQPTACMNYEKTSTGEWLAHCGSCSTPEYANAFTRSGINFKIINGLLGMDKTPSISVTDENTADREEAKRAWKEIAEWVEAATVKRTLKNARFGYLGNYYPEMLDMYSDFTLFQAKTGVHIVLLEMCDLKSYFDKVTEKEVKIKREQISHFFIIAGDSPSEPIAKKPNEEQLNWSARVAVAQEKMVKDFDLDALAYFYKGADNNEYERIQGGFIVGHSLLTAAGIPCSGEGDIKTALSMKICDIVDKGGSFAEFAAVDYVLGTVIMGHDGPFHIKISDGKPVLRAMGLYHGKRSTGVSVEANVVVGDITTLWTTQTVNGKLKFIVTEGKAIKGPKLMIGNTQTHIDFGMRPDYYMDRLFNEAPAHHCAISVGQNSEIFKKIAYLLDIDCVVIKP